MMDDPLFARAGLAIEEARTLRDEARSLHADEGIRLQTRLTVLKSAAAAVERKAYRDNKDSGLISLGKPTR